MSRPSAHSHCAPVGAKAGAGDPLHLREMSGRISDPVSQAVLALFFAELGLGLFSVLWEPLLYMVFPMRALAFGWTGARIRARGGTPGESALGGAAVGAVSALANAILMVSLPEIQGQSPVPFYAALIFSLGGLLLWGAAGALAGWAGAEISKRMNAHKSE